MTPAAQEFRIPSPGRIPEDVFWALRSIPTQQQVLVSQYGGTKQGLGLDDLDAIVIAHPDAGEQEAIVKSQNADCARIDSLEARVDAAITLLNEYRTALISAAVTGKVAVTHESAA